MLYDVQYDPAAGQILFSVINTADRTLIGVLDLSSPSDGYIIHGSTPGPLKFAAREVKSFRADFKAVPWAGTESWPLELTLLEEPNKRQLSLTIRFYFSEDDRARKFPAYADEETWQQVPIFDKFVNTAIYEL